MAILCGYCHHPKLWQVRLSISTELVSLALYIRVQLLDIPLTKALIKLELNRQEIGSHCVDAGYPRGEQSISH